ncbi:MAG: hypothetical protein ABSG64_13925 [Solirubrobacteraceae bacterium]
MSASVSRESRVVATELLVPGSAAGDRGRSPGLGWSAPAGIEYAEWVHAGRALTAGGFRAAWGVGDWLGFGIRRFATGYPQAQVVTGYSVQGLRNMVHVASRFELARRRPAVSWSAHAVLAALPSEVQALWLDRVESERLSVHALREALRADRRGERSADPAITGVPRAARCPLCAQPVSV